MMVLRSTCFFSGFGWMPRTRSERKMARSSGKIMEHWSMYDCCMIAVGSRKLGLVHNVACIVLCTSYADYEH